MVSELAAARLHAMSTFVHTRDCNRQEVSLATHEKIGEAIGDVSFVVKCFVQAMNDSSVSLELGVKVPSTVCFSCVRPAVHP